MDPIRGTPPSSKERKQIGTSCTEYEHSAVELRAHAAVKQRRGEGGWRVTQDGCDQN